MYAKETAAMLTMALMYMYGWCMFYMVHVSLIKCKT